MTTSDHRKILKQLKPKPFKHQKFIKHNSPKKRSCGINLHHCIRCGRTGGHIKQYGLKVCRQCFREIATKLGFKKYS